MIADEISKIGNKLCRCDEKCDGINRNQDEGIYPRWLVLEEEEDGTPMGLGTVVCGLNPAKASPGEKQAMKPQSKVDYEHQLGYYWKKIKIISYYARPRNFIKNLGRNGPILWTDVVKCENKSKEERLTFKQHSATFRHCANKFLYKEIRIVPKNWLIVCLGREAYHAIIYSFPDRPILGVPHPTGSRNQFQPFFESNGELKSKFKKQISQFFKNNPTGAIWINPNLN